MTNERKNVPELRFPGFTKEWKQKNIGDYIKELKMFETQQGSGFSIATSSRKGLFKQEDYFDGERTFSKNDVSYSVVPPNFITYRHMSDDNIFKFNINSFNENLLVSKEYPVFDVNNQADKKFVFYELNNNNNFLKFCIKQKKGGTRTRLYFKVLEKYKTFFPTILEQEKIGDFFSKLDQQIELEEQKLEKLEEQKKGYMQKIFSQKLRFKDENGDEYPEWKSKKLKDIANVYQPQNLSQNNFQKKGYPVYGANGVIGYYKDFNHSNMEIAVACRGNTCGRVNLTEPKSWITSNAMVVNIIDKMEIEFYFLYQYLRIINYSNVISGSGQPQITRKNMNSVELLVPNYIEQQKIGNLFRRFDDFIEKQSQKIDLLKERKKGFLQKIFV